MTSGLIVTADMELPNAGRHVRDTYLLVSIPTQFRSESCHMRVRLKVNACRRLAMNGVRQRRTLSALFFVCSLLLALVQCSDRKETEYPTTADAIRDRAFDRGWLPRIIPRNATDIREIHNVDTNQGNGRFSFAGVPRGDLLALDSSCRILTHTVEVRSFRVKWWPRALSGQLDPQQFSTQGFEAYECGPSTRFYVALKWSSSVGYFWH